MSDAYVPEADALEQRRATGTDSSGPAAATPLPREASEADVVEQRDEVPVDDADDRR